MPNSSRKSDSKSSIPTEGFRAKFWLVACVLCIVCGMHTMCSTCTMCGMCTIQYVHSVYLVYHVVCVPCVTCVPCVPQKLPTYKAINYWTNFSLAWRQNFRKQKMLEAFNRVWCPRSVLVECIWKAVEISMCQTWNILCQIWGRMSG